MDSSKTPFDTPWKEILEDYFPEFMDFFFPSIFAQIDWAKGFQFMDGELQQLAREAETTRMHTDKLVQVTWRDGSEYFILLHVEVQCQKEEDFALRVYTYFARIRDRFRLPVISLVILGDENATWKPQSYEEELGGCRLRFDFPVVKLLEYKSQQAALATSRNPFAYVVLAHLAALATKGKNRSRLNQKFAIVTRLYDAGFSEQEIVNLFRFADWVMTLPPDLEANFQQQLREFEGARTVTYISSFERLGMEKALTTVVLGFFEQKFPSLPSSVRGQLEALNASQVEELSRVLASFNEIEQLTTWLDQNNKKPTT
jgi:hypothetical protein